MAKRNTSTKTAAQKKASAKRRVEDLVGNITLEETIGAKTTEDPKNVIVEIEQNKSVEWLQEQVDLLTTDKTQLENEIIALKESGGSTELTTIKNGVIQMFKDLEDNLLGKNPQNVNYENTSIKAQLDRMLQRFNFLRPQ